MNLGPAIPWPLRKDSCGRTVCAPLHPEAGSCQTLLLWDKHGVRAPASGSALVSAIPKPGSSKSLLSYETSISLVLNLARPGCFLQVRSHNSQKIRIWPCRQRVCRSKNPPSFCCLYFLTDGETEKADLPKDPWLISDRQGLELRTSVESAALPTTTPRQIPWLEHSGNFVASQVHWFVTGRSHGHSIH